VVGPDHAPAQRRRKPRDLFAGRFLADARFETLRFGQQLCALTRFRQLPEQCQHLCREFLLLLVFGLVEDFAVLYERRVIDAHVIEEMDDEVRR
jgi:hypothetical protein